MSKENKLTHQQLALVIGAKCNTPHYTLESVSISGVCLLSCESKIGGIIPKTINCNDEAIRPILSPLSALTLEDAHEIAMIQRGTPITTNKEVKISALKVAKVDTIREGMNCVHIEFLATEGELLPVQEKCSISICNWGVINFYVSEVGKRVNNFSLSNNVRSREIWSLLISKRYDIFGWIEQNLAIDKTKMK